MSGASIPIPFALGEELWRVNGPTHEEHVVCPECVGTKVVRVMQGNGERYELDCHACGDGHMPSRGWVSKTVYAYAPQRFVPRRVDFERGEARYATESPNASCWRPVSASDLYRTREECQAACDEKTAAEAVDQHERLIRSLKHKRDALAWSVHYWRGQRKRRMEEVEAIDRRLRECKERDA